MSVAFEFDTDLAQEAKRFAADVVGRWHPDLKEHEVTFTIGLAYNRDKDGQLVEDEPPLKDDQRAVYFKISTTPTVQRADHRADVQILLDGHHWTEQLPDADKIAILDCAISFLEVRLDKDKVIITDPQGRPKLGIKAADWDLRGFEAVARRHGEHSIEVQQGRKFQERFGQVVLAAEAAPLFA